MRRKSFPSSSTRSAVFSALVAILACFVSATSDAHGVVGNRIFLSPIVGNDAFPDNALDLTARRSDYGFSLLPEFEKLLSDDSSLLFVGGWDRLEPNGERDTSGARDLTIYFRQSILVSPEHELEFTVSPFLGLPTGNRRIGDQGYTHLGGELLFAKGFGDLPDSPRLMWLRPFAVQAEAGYAGRIAGPANSDVFANLEIEYSLRYLDRFVAPLELRRPWVDLVPYVQFNYAQAPIGSRLTTSPDFRFTPGLAYMGDWCELSIGAQVALNRTAQRGDSAAVIGWSRSSTTTFFRCWAGNRSRKYQPLLCASPSLARAGLCKAPVARAQARDDPNRKGIPRRCPSSRTKSQS